MSEAEILASEAHETRSVTVPKGLQGWKDEAQRILEEAKALKVVDNESYLAVREGHARWSLRAKALWDLLNPACQAAATLHSSVVADRDSVQGPIQDAVKVSKAKLIAYEVEQKRLRELEQIRLQAEAKAKAEAEALELAEQLERAGLKEEASEVIDAPVAVPVVVAPLNIPKGPALRARTVYAAEVFSLGDLVGGWVIGRVPVLAIMPNQKFLDEQARSLKEAMDWPGVKVVSRKV